MVQTKSQPNSRGVSPARRNGAAPTNGNLNKQSKSGPTRRSQSLTRKNNNNNNNRSRGVSPAKSVTGTTKSKTPPHNNGNQPVLVQSRGSELGSMDFLESMTQSSGSTEPSTPGDNINVVVRVRPLSEKEIREGDDMVIQFPGNGQLLCEAQNNGSKSAQQPKQFSYNVVFEPGATQDDIVQYSGIKRLIEMAIEGFSCTAFCYGQTGSGKTHTLTGPPELFIGKPDPSHEYHGLVFRSFLYLFQQIKLRTDMNFVLQASFLEIYNEKVIDLLNPGSARKPLAVRWSKKSRGFFVENLFTVDCEELDDLLAVLEEGMRNRSTGSHHMNEHSSRSHTILTVHITSEQQAENGVYLSKQGKINFVDLAGSEMTKKTHSEGKTLEEANNINKSLMVLGYCIAQLSDAKKKTGHIPYRDSKLTKLLADSLAGNGVTLMIACISPARSNLSETINTLRYAARAKKIRTKPIIMMDPREALILSLKREVNNLTMENEHLKAALHLHSDTSEIVPYNLSEPPRPITPAPKVDLEKLAELEGSELAELVKLYMKENEALRSENSELYSTREMVLRDQEIVCRENERLLKKLEDVNSSPIIESKGTFRDELGRDMQSEMWRNPINGSTDSVASLSKYRSTEHLSGRVSANECRIPDDLQKELDRRRIGESINQIANTIRRHNSDHSITGPKSRGSSGTVKKMSPNSAEHRAARRTEPLIADDRPFSSVGHTRPNSNTLVRAISDTNKDSLIRSKYFGSTVSLHDADDPFKKVVDDQGNDALILESDTPCVVPK